MDVSPDRTDPRRARLLVFAIADATLCASTVAFIKGAEPTETDLGVATDLYREPHGDYGVSASVTTPVVIGKGGAKHGAPEEALRGHLGPPFLYQDSEGIGPSLHEKTPIYQPSSDSSPLFL